MHSQIADCDRILISYYIDARLWGLRPLSINLKIITLISDNIILDTNAHIATVGGNQLSLSKRVTLSLS